MKKWWILYRIFTIFMFDTVKKATSNEDDDIENNTTLSMVDKMELNAVDNAKNITELNTVQNVILNNTNIEYNFTDYDEMKELVMKELHKRNRQRFFITQIIIQIVVIAIILVIVIIAIIKNKYIKLNSFHHVAREYFQKMRSRSYIITINNIEAGSIWDTRQTYNNMLAKRREREALRSIFYYSAQQEFHDDSMEFVRIEPQRQTV
ncbi:uncharacterized protein LOC105258801 [Camponotus floridanus]|uniref:uncharacterized protein LOC105258801 n=1 Tax=Camponotus floridanus TaxID=104421 RepID=UPI000DC6CDDD|nr:uncharacterized protein LOC105258801 [Camponotus floridanus]